MFLPLCICSYIYEFTCWILFKAPRLVNELDTKDNNELKEDHNINYNVGSGVWAQFRDKFLMHWKLLKYLLLDWSFLDSGWRENLWAPIQCWSTGSYAWLVSYFLFESFIYLFINYECLLHGFGFCCFTFCLQKMPWIKEFSLKFTNFKMQINLISIIYKIFIYGLFVYLVVILDFGYLLIFYFCKCKYAQLHIFNSKSACTLHSKVQILLLFHDWIWIYRFVQFKSFWFLHMLF